MRYLSLFSGIEAASVAWEPLGWEPMAFAEVDDFPAAVLAHRWPDVPNLGDVCKVDWRKFVEDYGRPDVLIGGSPCFETGTLVLCESGYKPIEQVEVGDMVVTHKGRLRPVVATGHQDGAVGTLKVHGMVPISCTSDHPILTSRRTKCDRDTNGCWFRFHDTGFTPASESVGRCACSVTDVKCEIPEFPDVYGLMRNDVCELIGWYLGDGSIAGKGKNNPTVRFLELSISPIKLVRFVETFKQKLSYTVKQIDDSRCKVFIYNTEFCRFLETWFGRGAANKNLPAWVFALSYDERTRIFEGYSKTDGSVDKNGVTRCDSVSKAMIIGMQQMLAKGSAFAATPRGNREIKGTVYETKQTFGLAVPSGNSNVWIRNGYANRLICSYDGRRECTVYNLEVADDNSYTADGIAVHNCQSFSVAGGRESLDGESRLMYEYIRACEEVRSPWILWENVPGVLNVRDGAFGQLLQELQRIGYVSLAWRVLDAQFVRVAERDDNGRITGWFGPVAQRRRRVFLVGHLGEWDGCAAAVLFESESVSGNTKASGKKREELASAARECAQGDSEPIAFKYSAGAAARTMPTYGDGSCNTLTADWHAPAIAVRTAQTGANGCGISEEVAHTLDTTGPEAVAFAQNQRDELRLIGGDGKVASSVNAQRWGNYKGETLICVSSPATNAEVCDDQSPTLLSRQYKDPPYIVIDRAAYNQGKNAQYDPYIAAADVMPPLVARGPHAVGYEPTSAGVGQSEESTGEDDQQDCGHEPTIDFGEGGSAL